MVHAFQRIDDWRTARARAGRMLLALDFDGTLAPIVPIPDEAAMLPSVQAALGHLIKRTDTVIAVVSGRALADVRPRVGFDQINYAGNHGLEIEGPDGLHRMHDEAEQARPALAACAAALRNEFADEDAILVEDKRLTLSVHFRRVTDQAREQSIRDQVERHCGDPLNGLRLTEGKKVVEIRPAVDWDKGRATAFLMDTLLDGVADAPVVYIGDDRTDEDAFATLRGRGEGVIVADRVPTSSHALAWLRSPDEVATLIAQLAED